MDSTTIAMLSVEAMGKQRLPNAQTVGCWPISCMEYCKVSTRAMEVEWESFSHYSIRSFLRQAKPENVGGFMN